jgi:hypothetical protein
VSDNVLGGGERAVLEARSLGIHVITEEDNPKLKEVCVSERVKTQSNVCVSHEKRSFICIYIYICLIVDMRIYNKIQSYSWW